MDLILRAAGMLAEQFPDDIVAIGGVAVYLHALEDPTFEIETTHDVDVSISRVAFSTLRDFDEVVRDTRQRKNQITRDGIDIDLYVEHQHGLAIDYEMLVRHSERKEGVLVAAKEHLLILKTDSAQNRSGSSKGDKDRRDLVTIVMLMTELKHELLVDLGDDRYGLLRDLGQRDAVFIHLTGDDTHEAARLRNDYLRNLESIGRVIQRSSERMR